MLRTFYNSHAKGFSMDNFTFGMFSEMDDYNAREEVREFEEWHRMMDGDEWSDSDDDVIADDEWSDSDDDFAADYYGEQDFG
jgi:hypothetical protein